MVKKKEKVTKKKEKESVGVVLRRVGAMLQTAIQNLNDGIDHLSEADLGNARDAVMRAMDIVANEKVTDQLDESVAEIQEKMDAIEELESELC